MLAWAAGKLQNNCGTHRKCFMKHLTQVGARPMVSGRLASPWWTITICANCANTAIKSRPKQHSALIERLPSGIFPPELWFSTPFLPTAPPRNRFDNNRSTHNGALGKLYMDRRFRGLLPLDGPVDTFLRLVWHSCFFRLALGVFRVTDILCYIDTLGTRERCHCKQIFA